MWMWKMQERTALLLRCCYCFQTLLLRVWRYELAGSELQCWLELRGVQQGSWEEAL
jgi:hypothetical protein